MRTQDPYANFDFIVEIDGNQVGGFSEVTGLQVETEVEETREGGVNHYLHKLAKITKYRNLVLKRGITDATQLWSWHQQVVAGKVDRKTLSVVLRDSKQVEKWRWIFSDAFPIKWSSTDLNAASGSVAVESVEFAHQGMTKS